MMLCDSLVGKYVTTTTDRNRMKLMMVYLPLHRSHVERFASLPLRPL